MLSQWAALGIQAIHPASQYSDLLQKAEKLNALHIAVKVGIKDSVLRLIMARKTEVNP